MSHLGIWISKPVNLIGFLLIFFSTSGCQFEDQKRFIFFLHNRFLETHELDDTHPQYGSCDYKGIISEFEESGAQVISEIRKDNVNARDYATKLVGEITQLIDSGIAPNKITVIGTSKGGYIAQYVSTLMDNPDLNFVFIASFRDQDLIAIPEINYCGNILTIFEKSDPFGVSALERKIQSACVISNFKEIEINTGLSHGFLFRPLPEWINPCIKWSKNEYTFK